MAKQDCYAVRGEEIGRFLYRIDEIYEVRFNVVGYTDDGEKEAFERVHFVDEYLPANNNNLVKFEISANDKTITYERNKGEDINYFSLTRKIATLFGDNYSVYCDIDSYCNKNYTTFEFFSDEQVAELKSSNKIIFDLKYVPVDEFEQRESKYNGHFPKMQKSEKKKSSKGFFAGPKAKNGITASQFMEKAEQGDSEAQRYLGRCYYFGYGVDKSNKIAYEWFVKSAEQGDIKACWHVCYMVSECREFRANREVFTEYLIKLADLGDAEAQLRYGGYVNESYSFLEYQEKYFLYLQKAVEQNYVPAIKFLIEKNVDIIPRTLPRKELKKQLYNAKIKEITDNAQKGDFEQFKLLLILDEMPNISTVVLHYKAKNPELYEKALNEIKNKLFYFRDSN